jgi:isopentenyl phosphate kinase
MKGACVMAAAAAAAAAAGFVVVHGAGSFGHFEASQYGITKPDTPQHTLLEGFAKTRRSVTLLNHLVVSAMIDAGLPAVGLSPYGSCYCQNGALHPDWQQGYVDAVQATLSRCAGLVYCHSGYVVVQHTQTPN